MATNKEKQRKNKEKQRFKKKKKNISGKMFPDKIWGSIWGPGGSMIFK